MRAQEHMAKVLENTGLYIFTGDSPVEWELAAYSEGFSLLEERFDRILENLFLDTAGRDMIACWERLFRPQPSTAELEDCRESVKRRFAVHPDSFTPKAVEALLPGAGVYGQLLEKENGLVILLGRLMGIKKEEAERELNQLLPAHLPWEWDESVTWVAFDAYSRSFAEWDAVGVTWEQLDQLARENLDSMFKN